MMICQGLKAFLVKMVDFFTYGFFFGITIGGTSTGVTDRTVIFFTASYVAAFFIENKPEKAFF